jgi:hypothetical protein
MADCENTLNYFRFVCQFLKGSLHWILQKKMKKYLPKIVSVTISLCICVGWISCRSSTESQPNTVAWPLKVGDTWIYRYLGYDNQGSQTSDYIDSTFFSRDTIINGETWFVINNSSSAFGNRNDGLWRYALTNTSSPFLVVKYPTLVGDTYNIGSYKATVASINEPLNLPAGNFNCIKLEIKGTDATDFIEEEYIVPNIGQVRTVRFNISASGASIEANESNLVSYTLK